MERKPGLLDYDGPVMRFSHVLVSLLLSNLLFMVCCLPVVTLAPALIALTSVSLRCYRTRQWDHVCRYFLTSFGRNLRRGIPLSLFFIAVFGSILLDFGWLLGASGRIAGIVLGMLCVVTILLLMLAQFLFPVLCSETCTLSQAIWRAAQLCVLHWPRVLFPALTVAGLAALFYLEPLILSAILPLILLVGFSLVSYLFVVAAAPALEKT